MNVFPSLRILLRALLIVLSGSVLVWWLLGRPATGIDDADIFFVYAKHFAAGQDFVYNLGAERVEGFTSLLWTLICACLFRVSHQVEVPLYLINLLIGIATIRACLCRTKNRAVFIMLLLAVPAWFAWCQVTLMETGLWCGLLTLVVLLVVERRPRAVALLLPLLVITRPESMLWGLWLILILGLPVLLREGWRKALGTMVLPAAVFGISLGVLIVFRMQYFGYPVPNTYYAKVSPNLLYDLRNGIVYLLLYLVSNPAVLLATVVWGGVLVRGLRRWREGLDDRLVLALCLLPGIGIPVLVGGDHFGGFRFYQPLWPLLCLLVAGEWPAIAARFRPSRARRFLPVLVLCGWALFPFTSMMKHEFRIAREGRETGRALTDMFGDLDPLPTVATITAGGSKYGYPGPVFDLMGLNATEMAHAPGPRTGYKNHTAFNRAVFYAWHPDILLCGDDPAFDAKVLKGLLSEDEFRRLYVKLDLQRNGKHVQAYYAHAFLKQVHQTGP